MKYIISESRLHNIMKNYLDSFLDVNIHYNSDPYIIIEHNLYNDEDIGESIDMEYDRTDGRLYINKSFLNSFMSWFAQDIKYSQDFISKWFENKFKVEVKFAES